MYHSLTIVTLCHVRSRQAKRSHCHVILHHISSHFFSALHDVLDLENGDLFVEVQLSSFLRQHCFKHGLTGEYHSPTPQDPVILPIADLMNRLQIAADA